MERVNEEDYSKPMVHHLGKKQHNKLVDIGSKVPVVAGGVPGPMDRDELTYQLGRFGYVDNFVNSGYTNTRRPAMVEAILGKSAKERRSLYIAGVGGVEDYMGIVDCVTEAVTARTPIVFRMVYGATEQASLRSIGYPIPAMLAMRRLAKVSDVPAHLQIVYTSNISGTLNNLDMEKINDEQQRMTREIGRVASELEVAEVTGFFDDSSVDLARLPSYVELLRDKLSQEQLKALQAKDRSVDLSSSLGYAAAHYLVHDYTREFRHMGYAPVPERASIVDVGGKQEEYFLGIRRVIDDEIGEIFPRDPFVFTRHSVPPYYMARGGDIGLEDYMLNPGTPVMAESLGSAALHDLSFMAFELGLPKIHRPEPIPHGVSVRAQDSV